MVDIINNVSLGLVLRIPLDKVDNILQYIQSIQDITIAHKQVSYEKLYIIQEKQ